MTDRAFIQVDPELPYHAWVYDDGSVYHAKIKEKVHELGPGSFFLGSWDHSPDREELQEAFEVHLRAKRNFVNPSDGDLS